MDILAVAASPRRNSNSETLLHRMLAGAEAEGAAVRLVRLRDYTYSSCVGCERCRKDKACTRFRDGMSLLYPLIEEARGLALATPVHNYNVTALLKGFIDRLYCYFDFTDERPRRWESRLAGQGRAAALACIGEQPDRESLGVAMPAMRMPLKTLGYSICGEMEVLSVFDAGRVARFEDTMLRAFETGRNLARSLPKR